MDMHRSKSKEEAVTLQDPADSALHGGTQEEINPILDDAHIDEEEEEGGRDEGTSSSNGDEGPEPGNVKKDKNVKKDSDPLRRDSENVGRKALRVSLGKDTEIEMVPVSISHSSPAILDGRELNMFESININGGTRSSLRSRAGSGAICLEEIVPANCQIEDEGQGKRDFWKMSLDAFTSKKRGKSKDDKRLPRSVRSYYKAQDDLITTFEATANLSGAGDLVLEGQELDEKTQKQANYLAKASFGVNLILMIAKLVASILSGSLVVISSLVDSAVDLMSGVVIWWTSRAVKKRNRYVYPEGKTRLEPIAIVILSVIMAVASVQLIGQSIQSIVSMSKQPGQEGAPVIDVPTVVIIGFTIASKLILFIVCKVFRSPLVDALGQDHRNDVISNSGALIFGYLAYKVWKYFDPIGAILMSIYIVISWWITGSKQIKMLTGYTAKPHFLKKLTWVCLNHSEQIRYIDTVRAFHFGTNYIVEVDIVLPENMTVKEAHDIGEPLQQKLESMPSVERAFVHLDYEFEHDPNREHKVV